MRFWRSVIFRGIIGKSGITKRHARKQVFELFDKAFKVSAVKLILEEEQSVKMVS
ncbi:hypothetical protein [Streptococcus varani]|uniref:hypothetical protein n=1 Tax=Streptococcus varani TaxID=1608583 RepID=UPI000B15EAD6|nr:hypothetical protein [Streptococcus varani]